MRVDVELENWPTSPTVRVAEDSYARLPASLFKDKPADLSQRQAVFYRNLIRIALAVRSSTIPVDFEDHDGTTWFLDRGCVKIAEHAGFVRPLCNDDFGVVSALTLTWSVQRVER